MRAAGFIIILALVFALTGYVCWHLWRISPQGWKPVVTGVYLFWMACLFAGFFWLERIPVKAATILYEVGNTWLIAFLYLLILFIFADIAALCHLLPKALLNNSLPGLVSAIGIVAVVMIALMVLLPYLNDTTTETFKKLSGSEYKRI